MIIFQGGAEKEERREKKNNLVHTSKLQ